MASKIQNCFPDRISKAKAWSAFDYVFSSLDWRLRIESVEPLSFVVEYGE